MLPQITSGALSAAPLPQARAQREGGPSAAGALAPSPIGRAEPPVTRVISVPQPEDRRRAALYPPAPDPPTGPPPAFDATPLERTRELLLRPPLLAVPPSPDAEETGEPWRQEPDDKELSQKTEAEIAEVRRIAEPGPEPEVDVTF